MDRNESLGKKEFGKEDFFMPSLQVILLEWNLQRATV